MTEVYKGLEYKIVMKGSYRIYYYGTIRFESREALFAFLDEEIERDNNINNYIEQSDREEKEETRSYK